VHGQAVFLWLCHALTQKRAKRKNQACLWFDSAHHEVAREARETHLWVSFPHPFVIPAKAGIYPYCGSLKAEDGPPPSRG